MAEVRVLTTATLHPAATANVRALLDAAFDGEMTEDDWAHCLGGAHVVALDGGQPVAHAALVPRAFEIGAKRWRCGYLEGVATAPSRQGQGLGTRLLRRVDELLRAGYEVGVLATDAQGFYERLGWERWQGPSYVRNCVRRERSADEDDGIMVRRFGPSLGVDLTDPIIYEARAGDDW